MKTTPCLICRRPVYGRIPPDPYICSNECDQAFYMHLPAQSNEQRRICAGIPIRADKKAVECVNIPF